jgi:hypothetical protein
VYAVLECPHLDKFLREQNLPLNVVQHLSANELTNLFEKRSVDVVDRAYVRIELESLPGVKPPGTG